MKKIFWWWSYFTNESFRKWVHQHDIEEFHEQICSMIYDGNISKEYPLLIDSVLKRLKK